MKNFSSLKEVLEIESRIEHMETLALWIAKETAGVDQTISQTGTLISTVCEDIRERILELVRNLEERIQEFEKVIH